MRTLKKMISFALTFALILSTISLPGVSLKANATDANSFTLYYYLADNTDTLYMDIWNHAGIEFASTTTTSTDWGWNYPQGILQPVSGNANWYSIDVSIIASADDGFDIYQGSNSNKLATYDNQWNSTEDYATLVSGTSSVYSIKDGTLSTSDPTSKDDDTTSNYTIAELTELKATIPADYQTMGFTQDSVKAVTAALETADSLVASGDAADAAKVTAAYTALAEAINGLAFDSTLFVKKIANYDEDNSIRGVDVSSYLSIMDSFEQVKANMKADGVSEDIINNVGFKDFDGNVLDKQGFFDLLAASGVNYVRTRVWNNPYDSDGNGYGGGNNDIDKAVEIGSYVTKAGMKNLIDFHFSDFWADPGKQKAPKAWEDYTIEQKAAAVTTFVTESLTTLENGGADISMVQIGNETNGKFCGESDWANMNILFDAGCDAVHAFDADILAAIHFTNPEKEGNLASYAANLSDYDGDNDDINEGVSYDVFATSYYPYWHGTMSNLTNVLSTVASTYDKYVMVAETSWANTFKEGDGHENTIMDESDLGDFVNYNVSLQGQANEIRDVANAVNSINVTLENGEKAGLGFFYWEPAWIPVQSMWNEDGTALSEKEQASLLEANKELWEKCGSGWASSAASEYDPDDAGLWYGGSAVDNQAVFDFNGNPLSTLNVFKYFAYGAVASEVSVDGYSCTPVTIQVGETIDSALPDTVEVTYNDSTTGEEAVTWNKEDIEKINAEAATNKGIGTYNVNGYLTNNTAFAVTCTIMVEPVNLLANPGFEEEEDSSWTITGTGATITTDDPKSGSKSLHFYDSSDMTFKASNTTVVTTPGYYNASIYIQGLSSAGSREGESLTLNAVTGDGTEYISSNITLNGWLSWQKATIEGIYVSPEMIKNGQNTIILSLNAALNAEAWGTIDEAYLYLSETSISDASVTLEATEYTYDGTAKTPAVTVKLGDKTLVKDTDYTVTYSNNTSVGTATVTINGINIYADKIEKTFTIKAAAASEPSTQAPAATTQAPAATTQAPAATTQAPAATTQAPAATTQAPAATDDTPAAVTTTTVKKVTLSSVKNKKSKKMVVAWKKLSGVSGYQIKYSTSKTFKASKTKTVTVKKASTKSVTIKKLTKKKTYYVKVRAYKTVNGKKVYGKYSAVKKVTIKK